MIVEATPVRIGGLSVGRGRFVFSFPTVAPSGREKAARGLLFVAAAVSDGEGSLNT